MLIRIERWCVLTSGPEFSGLLKPGNWGIDVIEVILVKGMDISIDDRIRKTDSLLPLL
jgi:hypothetical protein